MRFRPTPESAPILDSWFEINASRVYFGGADTVVGTAMVHFEKVAGQFTIDLLIDI